MSLLDSVGIEAGFLHARVHAAGLHPLRPDLCVMSTCTEIGTLREHITKVLEADEHVFEAASQANGTVMPYNFAFYLQTDAKVQKAQAS